MNYKTERFVANIQEKGQRHTPFFSSDVKNLLDFQRWRMKLKQVWTLLRTTILKKKLMCLTCSSKCLMNYFSEQTTCFDKRPPSLRKLCLCCRLDRSSCLNRNSISFLIYFLFGDALTSIYCHKILYCYYRMYKSYVHSVIYQDFTCFKLLDLFALILLW